MSEAWCDCKAWPGQFYVWVVASELRGKKPIAGGDREAMVIFYGEFYGESSCLVLTKWSIIGVNDG